MFGRFDVKVAAYLKFMVLSKPMNSDSIICFQFDDIYIINELWFDAWSLDIITEDPFLYILQVSKDGFNWSTVIDHSNCKCYSVQQLYFPRHATRLEEDTACKMIM